MNIGVRVDAKPPSPRLERDVARLAELWGEGLSRFGGPWLAGGRFSAVDAFMRRSGSGCEPMESMSARRGGLGRNGSGASGYVGLGSAGLGRNVAGTGA